MCIIQIKLYPFITIIATNIINHIQFKHSESVQKQLRKIYPFHRTKGDIETNVKNANQREEHRLVR